MLVIESSNAGDGVARQRRESDPWVQAEDGHRGAHYRQVTVGTLPDVPLLEIFNFYVDETGRSVGWWKLVHVCQRWRYIVFASQKRLRLQLCCTGDTPVRAVLDVWPALPLVVSNRCRLKRIDILDNIVDALQHHDRVCEISFWYLPGWLLGSLATMAQGPYPELTSLELRSDGESSPVLHNSFSGGSVPRLRTLVLDSVSFHGLPKLLLTASNLVQLHLHRIPNSGYISPDAMVACVLTMNNLESFILEYSSPLSHPYRASRRPPPPTRVVLPSLTHFSFHGTSEYLEEFLAQVDAPLLYSFYITFFNRPAAFDLSQLPQFISRTEKIKALTQAALDLYDHDCVIEITPSTQTRTAGEYRTLVLRVVSLGAGWQLSSLTQLCDLVWPLPSTLESLEIYKLPFGGTYSQWMELLSLFTAVKSLYLSKGIARRVVRTLQGLTRESIVMDVLPSLRNIFVEGLKPTRSVHRAIGWFVATRQPSGHPLTVDDWVP